jgi:hypothetical protein
MERIPQLVCALAIVATVLFLGQFLSTFDPFYRVVIGCIRISFAGSS